jgi:hypothetical protein
MYLLLLLLMMALHAKHYYVASIYPMLFGGVVGLLVSSAGFSGKP